MNTTSTTDRGSFDSFDEALVGELRQVVLARADAPQRRRGRRPALAAAGIAAVVAASFGINSLGSSSAFAVARTENGDIRIAIHRLDDAAGLERELASYGIDSTIDYQPGEPTTSDPLDVGGGKLEGIEVSRGGAPTSTGSTTAVPDDQPMETPCGDPNDPPVTTDLQGDEFVITIPKASSLTQADSKLRITTTGKVADSFAGLMVGYVVDGVQCGVGTMIAGGVSAP